MRIALLTLGSRGDVQPYVALGTALKARGHHVLIVTGDGFDQLISSAGLDYGRIGVDFRALIANPDMKAALRSLPALIRAFKTSGELVERTFIDSWKAVQDADAIVYHPKLLAAPHIAERLGCPAILATVVPIAVPTDAFESPLFPMSSLGRWMNRFSHKVVLSAARRGFAGRVRAFRQDTLGLPTVSGTRTDILRVSGAPVARITGVSRTLVPMPPDEANAFTTGYWFCAPDNAWTPDPGLEQFLRSGPPPIYFGFGSMAGDHPARCAREVIRALKVLGRRGILASGWGGLKAADTPDHVHVTDEAPHSWLFPRCAALVHHGGAGTTHEGLRWGKPTLIRPVFGDQPFWGRRVAAIGAGPEPLPEKQFCGEKLVAALRTLSRETYRRSAAEIAQQISKEPGAGGAAILVERLATVR